MCGGVYAYKKVLAHLARKLKASSTNWLISIISPTPWLANILSRKINFSDQYPLKPSKLGNKFDYKVEPIGSN
jgi:ubiquitin-protein ligase